MTHAHLSMRYNRDVDDAARAIRSLTRGHGTASLTEARRFRGAMSELDGYRLVQPVGNRGQSECAILVRDGDLIEALGPIRLSDVPIPRRGKQYPYATGARTTRGTILATHMPSGVEGSHGFNQSPHRLGQVKAYRAAIGGLRQFVAEHPDVNEIWADWNLDARKPWVRAYLTRHFPEFWILAPDSGTYGPRVIDYALIRKGNGDWAAETVPNPASDHEAVVFTRQEAPMRHYARDQWGARAPEARYTFGGPDIDGIAIHWPAMSKPLRGFAAVSAALRGWQNYHMDTQGWSDIAYQEAVDQDGNTYELRGLTHKPGANGNDDLNNRFGALLLVLAPGERPTEAMLTSARNRIAEHRLLHTSSSRIVGHGQIRPGGTQCPGPITQGLIDAGALEPDQPARPKRPPTEEIDMTPDELRQIIREEIDTAFRGDDRSVLDLGKSRVEDPDTGTGLTLARWLKSTRDEVRAIAKKVGA